MNGAFSLAEFPSFRTCSNSQQKFGDRAACAVPGFSANLAKTTLRAGAGNRMKRFKYAVIGLGGLLALLLAAGVYFAVAFDANEWKGEIARAVMEKKQRILRIDGDLALSLFPRIGVRLGRSSLTERRSDKPFAELESAKLSLALLPLLRKEVVVDGIELVGVKARIVRRRDGTLNIADLLEREQKEEQAVRFDIAGARLVDAQAAYVDEGSGQAWSLAALNVTAGRLANASEGEVELVGKLRGNQPRISGELRVAAHYRYDLGRQEYALSRIAAGLAGELAGVKEIDVALAAASIRLRREEGELEIDGLSLLANGGDGADRFDVRVDAPAFAVAADKVSGAEILAQAKVSGSRTGNVRIGLSGIEGSGRVFKAARLVLALEASQGGTSVKADLHSPLAANLSTLMVELPQLAGELLVARPTMPMGSVKLALSGSLRADLAQQGAAVALTTRFDETRIQAQLNITRFAPLALGFAVDIDRLNVDKYFPLEKAATGARKPAQTFDLSALKGLDASGVVRVGQLRVANIAAGNVRLEFRAEDGRLEVAPHAASSYGGGMARAPAPTVRRDQPEALLAR
jgi:AsmA protein